MRRKFGKLINELAKKDDKVVLLVGDIGYGIFDDFRKNHKKKFFNMGICEQSIIGAAAGMALEGLKPWVYTITPFLIDPIHLVLFWSISISLKRFSSLIGSAIISLKLNSFQLLF